MTALYQSTQGAPASSRQIEYYAQQIGSDPMDATFESGLYTFGDLMPEAKAGKAVGAKQRLAEILAAAKLADVSGLDIFAVGEHHRLDMAISATPAVLAAIAAVTERIRVASAVTILSTADPTVVFSCARTVKEFWAAQRTSISASMSRCSG